MKFDSSPGYQSSRNNWYEINNCNHLVHLSICSLHFSYQISQFLLERMVIYFVYCFCNKTCTSLLFFQVPCSSTSCLSINIVIFQVVNNGNFGNKFLIFNMRDYLDIVLCIPISESLLIYFLFTNCLSVSLA